MARPRITVDEEALEHLIGLGVSIGLAADIMEVSESTIARHLKRNPEAHKRMTAARTRAQNTTDCGNGKAWAQKQRQTAPGICRTIGRAQISCS
uniref:hypothetical protein n=1 Tax=Gluconobacter oxydans TaxID=442 RepID=UPI00186824CE|nr:hypothetical protein [Gluconobacter oxydans]